MTRLLIAIVTVLALATLAPRAQAAEGATRSFIALVYHNVEDSDPDQSFVGVTTSKLVAQLSWLERNGYRPVSVDDLLAARDGRKALPDKAVLLTFDDGYESFYTRVLPILKAFRFPAVLALVGSWLEGGPDATVNYSADKAAGKPLGDSLVRFGDLKVKRGQSAGNFGTRRDDAALRSGDGDLRERHERTSEPRSRQCENGTEDRERDR